MKKILLSFFVLFIMLFLPTSNVLAVHVNGYYRSNGTYVNSYERTSPDSSPYNNYSYPGNYNPNTGSITGGSASTYLNNYYNKPTVGSSYTYPTSTYITTPTCPSMSTYDSSSDSCKCYSGYIVSGSSCTNASLYCSSKIGLMSQYNSLSKTCECMYGYEYDGSSCVYKSKYSSISSSTCPLNSSTSLIDSTKCSCYAGYQVNVTKDACVVALVKTQAELCKDSFGINSIPTSDDKCNCNTGYQWASDNKSCVVSPLKTNEQICQDSFGLNAIWEGTYSAVNGRLNCNCKTGFAWDGVNKSSCVVSVNTPSTLLFSTLKYGSSGKEVKNLQDKLIKKGYLKVASNGNFGPATLKAVKIFQADSWLTASGIVDIKTLESINK